ncbi:MAG: hypothetical protein H6936_15150 [Burkholderiales bacterium]|nr:hypothetical protein [Burkholderiales bacterium]
MSEGMIGVLLGVVISEIAAYFRDRIKNKEKQKIFLREKYEELAISFLNSFDSSIKLLNSKDSNDFDEVVISLKHENIMQLLAILYFSELKRAIEFYNESFKNLCEIAEKHHKPNDRKRVREQLDKNPEYNEAFKKFISAKNELQAQIEKNAKTYTGKKITIL